MLEFFTVDITSISSNVPESSYTEDSINGLAEDIIHLGTLVTPILLVEESIDSYKVVDRHLEFYASLKAYEQNPEEFDTVNAFILDELVNTDIVKQHIEHRNSQKKVDTKNTVNVPVATTEHPQDLSISALKDMFLTELSQHKRQLERIEQSLSNKGSSTTESVSQTLQLIDFINTSTTTDLEERLRTYKVKKNVIASILRMREQNHFINYEDFISRTKGLGDRGVIAMLDRHYLTLHRTHST